MKNILQGINSRINEAEKRISELEDRVVEITAAEQNKEKGMKKKMRTVSETSGITLNKPTFALQASQKEKTERKGLRKYLKRLQLKTPLTWERKDSLKSMKCRESHTG